MQAFGEFKAAWDPRNKHESAQSGRRLLAHRKFAARRGLQAAASRTRISIPRRSRFLRRRPALRCLGLGACRKSDAGTMCPSYMVTLEEEHSTRGRAHMLFEMLQGEVMRDGWKDEHVKKSLDLCLSCKACKSECPDERRHRHIQSRIFVALLRGASASAARLRFRHDRQMGSGSPRSRRALANLCGACARSSAVAAKGPASRAAAAIPRLAPQISAAGRDKNSAFPKRRSAMLRELRAPAGQGREVILWADTFNNYFHPETAGRRSKCFAEPVSTYGSATALLLRPPALRFRHARQSERISRAHPRLLGGTD